MKKERDIPPGLAGLITLQRRLGGEAIDRDPGLGRAYAAVRHRSQDELEAAVRRAWGIDGKLSCVRSLRWILFNLDRYLGVTAATVQSDAEAHNRRLLEERRARQGM